MTEDLTRLSLAEALALVRSQQISTTELTSACLDHINKINGKLNAFITITVEAAQKRAYRADRQLRQGKRLGLLLGIPIALKDLFETRGVRTTAGSSFFEGHVPDKDAEVVRKLKDAGAVILGKTNLHEIALGVTNVNPHFGACRNPWDTERVSGGSSGGSAAALATGMCLGALGSDTGGSIRIPASLCGIVGLKPTLGRVSLRGVIPLSWNLDHVGPMGRRVMDVAILLQVIQGYDASDAYSARVARSECLARIREGVSGWRIALAEDEYFARADEEVLAALHEAASIFADLGAKVDKVEFPGAREAAFANGLMVTSDAAAFHQDRLRLNPQGFGADVQERLRDGAAVTSAEYSQARRTQTLLRRQFEFFFKKFDILLTPTTPIPAPLIEGTNAVEQARLLTRFTAPFNLTGLPALSLPCGFTPKGLPIGLQVISKPWAEAHVLRAAYAYEQATDWHLRMPNL